MPINGRLTDGDIREIMRRAMSEGQSYGDDGMPLPEKVVSQAAADAMLEYLAGTPKEILLPDREQVYDYRSYVPRGRCRWRPNR